MRGLLALALMFGSFTTWAAAPDLPPDAGFKAYQKLLRRMQSERSDRFMPLGNTEGKLPIDPLERAVTLGARSSAWIDTLNKTRPKDKQLLTSTASEKGGVPPEAPVKYSPKIIAADLAKWEADAPAEIKQVLVTQENGYETEFTMPESDFLKINRGIQRLYSIAIRWKSMQDYLPWLTQNKRNDLRGYYFLSREENLQRDLENFNQLEPLKQETWRGYMIQICVNNLNSLSDCKAQVATAVAGGGLWNEYSRWSVKSKAIFERMFTVTRRGTDIHWNDAGKTILNSGVRRTGDMTLETYFHEILARVWNVGGAMLSANFLPNATLRIRFETGALAHYETGAIVMDERSDMQDPENQIMLAHEYGHALGFPDCYIEFYDEDEEAIINYQLDVENIMCSLNGAVNTRHFEELRKAY